METMVQSVEAIEDSKSEAKAEHLGADSGWKSPYALCKMPENRQLTLYNQANYVQQLLELHEMRKIKASC